MLGSKIVKVRKDHDCNFCDQSIRKGEEAEYLEGRSPKYDDEDNQAGIDYYKLWFHTYRCDLTPEQRESCAQGHHIWVNETKLDHYVGYHAVHLTTGREFCEICGEMNKSI